MPDNFAAALERLDFQFSDFGTMAEMIERLRVVLDVDHVSALQIDIAAQKVQADFRQATFEAVDRGQRLDIFRRAGQTVFQLRDARGRFVTSGARNIRTHFERNPSNV